MYKGTNSERIVQYGTIFPIEKLISFGHLDRIAALHAEFSKQKFKVYLLWGLALREQVFGETRFKEFSLSTFIWKTLCLASSGFITSVWMNLIEL